VVVEEVEEESMLLMVEVLLYLLVCRHHDVDVIASVVEESPNVLDTDFLLWLVSSQMERQSHSHWRLSVETD